MLNWFRRASGDAFPLRYKTSGSNGLDMPSLYGNITLPPRESVRIETGWRIGPLPDGIAGIVLARSSAWNRYGLVSPSHGSLYDSDYIGPVDYQIINLSDRPVKIEKGDAFVQMIFVSTVRVPGIDQSQTIRFPGARFGSTDSGINRSQTG